MTLSSQAERKAVATLHMASGPGGACRSPRVQGVQQLDTAGLDLCTQCCAMALPAELNTMQTSGSTSKHSSVPCGRLT